MRVVQSKKSYFKRISNNLKSHSVKYQNSYIVTDHMKHTLFTKYVKPLRLSCLGYFND